MPGLITSSNGFGVDLGAGGTLSNTGTITATAANQAAAAVLAAGTITNSGTILATGQSSVAVLLGQGGMLKDGANSNSVIQGEEAGVLATGAAASVADLGTVIATGAQGFGVDLQQGGDVAVHQVTASGYGGIGIELGGAGTVSLAPGSYVTGQAIGILTANAPVNVFARHARGGGGWHARAVAGCWRQLLQSGQPRWRGCGAGWRRHHQQPGHDQQ